jgi:kynurenine formamidase
MLRNRRVLAVLSAALLSTPAAALDLSNARVIDLTWSLDEKTLYWPSDPPASFKLQQISHGKTPAGFFYASNSFCTAEHGGTHLDAPIHFSEKGLTADQIPVTQLVGPAVVIDVSAAAAKDPDYRATPKDVAAWESKHGPIPAGAVVLLRTGWGSRWPDRKRYFGSESPSDASDLHFPSYGKDAAELLVKQRKVAALGVDTPSIDYGPSKDFIVHQVANGANVSGLENVAHLEQLPEKGAWVVALPLKIAGGSGSPARIIAFLPRGK